MDGDLLNTIRNRPFAEDLATSLSLGKTVDAVKKLNSERPYRLDGICAEVLKYRRGHITKWLDVLLPDSWKKSMYR